MHVNLYTHKMLRNTYKEVYSALHLIQQAEFATNVLHTISNSNKGRIILILFSFK